ncbi:type II toxin-antitoxin system VapC family toxin [Methylosinus sp. Ce-a6]|uniref:type II toxin-antitoxin system VapC family toxin n=1 Tax=Methylosinus sp. Ce-a6 TaxID=2172005 RepID=UPI00135A84C8|nr:type II toxin-antitoxin system VapC family toxin [Methylosinus sp. Ce-a6]
MIVIDASVAVKWIVREAHHEIALGIFDREWERIAPDLILPEVATLKTYLQDPPSNDGA